MSMDLTSHGTRMDDLRLTQRVRKILNDEAYRDRNDRQLGELVIRYLKGEISIHRAVADLDADFPAHND